MKLRLLCLLFSVPAFASAQTLPAGPKVTVSAVTQVAPTLPQYTRVDLPMLRELARRESGGRVEFNLKSWPEMSVQGPELIRLVRSGQVDMGAAPLTTVSGDVPFLDGIDLAGLAPELATARKIANALAPIANKELERIGVKLIATYPFPGAGVLLQEADQGPRRPERASRCAPTGLRHPTWSAIWAASRRRSPSARCTRRSSAARWIARSPARARATA
jgi:TRAP-type C4-dicarboxylate transport system substrate-binding protein